MNLKRYILPVVGLLIIFKAHCQEPIPEKIQVNHFLSSGVGFSSVKSFDNSLSPNVYSGYGVVLKSAFESVKTNKLNCINLTIGYAGTAYKASANPHRSEIYFALNTLKLWKVFIWNLKSNTDKTITFFLGPDIKLATNFRIPKTTDNNFFSYDVATSLGIAGAANTSVRFLKRRWIISDKLSVPLLIYLIRPSYTGPYPSNFIKDGVFKTTGYISAKTALTSGKFVTFNNYFNLNNEISLTYPFVKNNNMLRGMYEWNFYSTSMYNKKALFGSQTYLFSFLINM